MLLCVFSYLTRAALLARGFVVEKVLHKDPTRVCYLTTPTLEGCNSWSIQLNWKRWWHTRWCLCFSYWKQERYRNENEDEEVFNFDWSRISDAAVVEVKVTSMESEAVLSVLYSMQSTRTEKKVDETLYKDIIRAKGARALCASLSSS